MNFVMEGNNLIISTKGSIDSNNASDFGNEADKIINSNKFEKLILDFKEIAYVSSAGLRQILRLKKTNPNFKVINVNSEVYEVFEMTGFSEMMEVEKAFRELSVEGCEIIGEGSNGIVYRVTPDSIVKVYKNPDALDDIKRERELARTALVLGINTAISYDVVKVGDKYGSVFELLNSKSLTKLINEDKTKLDMYIKVFADILKGIHNTEVKNDVLPSAKKIAISWVEWLKGKIEDSTYDKLHKMLDDVKESNKIIHGDYHTNNLHYSNGEAILIDMDTLACGNPIFDFSSIFLAFRGFGELRHERVENFLHLDWETANLIWEKLLVYYFNTTNEKVINDVKNKAMTLGYVRMLRRTIKRESDDKELIDFCQKKLKETIDKVDSLSIE